MMFGLLVRCQLGPCMMREMKHPAARRNQKMTTETTETVEDRRTAMVERLRPEMPLIRYPLTDARLDEVEQEMAEAPRKVTDKATRKAATSALRTLAGYRQDIERARKVLKKDALDYGRRVDAEAKRIQARIAAIEAPIQEARIAYDERQKAAEEAARKAEQAILDRLDRLKRLHLFPGTPTANECRRRLTALEKFNPDELTGHEEEATELRAAQTERIRAILEEAEEQEAVLERARRTEIEAQKAREAADLERERLEQDRRKIEAEQAAKDREQAAKDREAARRAEQEKEAIEQRARELARREEEARKAEREAIARAKAAEARAEELNAQATHEGARSGLEAGARTDLESTLRFVANAPDLEEARAAARAALRRVGVIGTRNPDQVTIMDSARRILDLCPKKRATEIIQALCDRWMVTRLRDTAGEDAELLLYELDEIVETLEVAAEKRAAESAADGGDQ